MLLEGADSRRWFTHALTHSALLSLFIDSSPASVARASRMQHPHKINGDPPTPPPPKTSWPLGWRRGSSIVKVHSFPFTDMRFIQKAEYCPSFITNAQVNRTVREMWIRYGIWRPLYWSVVRIMAETARFYGVDKPFFSGGPDSQM